MTEKQILRAFRKLNRINAQLMGYQPFGWDRVTMRLVWPEWLAAYDRLTDMLRAVHPD